MPGIVASKAGLKHAGETPTPQVEVSLLLSSMRAGRYVYHIVQRGACLAHEKHKSPVELLHAACDA